MTKYVTPSPELTAFSCPHCGVLTTQYWFSALADRLTGDNPHPWMPSQDHLDDINNDKELDPVQRHELIRFIEKRFSGRPFLEKKESSVYGAMDCHNIYFSRCFDCKDLSVWLNKDLIYPAKGEAPLPNKDLSEEIKKDYLEASAILSISPRGIAALLRLAFQKLCKELGKPGKNINEDIAAFVKEGLDPRVQKSMDALRVIGNNAVHPGQIDLNDNRAIAESLFRLLNLVAEKLISEEKEIEGIYATLPTSAREAIEKRDGVQQSTSSKTSSESSASS